MGYDLHITRAGDWSESEDAPIALAEWLAVAAADPELTAMPENGDAFFAIGEPDDAMGWFNWFEGNVFTKNPDKRILAKMLVLASRLDAKVQGDDGEPYESPDDLDLSPDELFARIGDSGQTTPSDRHKRPDEPRRGSKWRWFRRR